jgi:hypothetical protein
LEKKIFPKFITLTPDVAKYFLSHVDREGRASYGSARAAKGCQQDPAENKQVSIDVVGANRTINRANRTINRANRTIKGADRTNATLIATALTAVITTTTLTLEWLKLFLQSWKK